MSNGETMLIAYDGTERAGRALEYAAQLLRPTTVEILTAWEPVARQTARAVSRTGMHQSTVSPDGVEEDPAYEEVLKICRQGIELAEQHGDYPTRDMLALQLHDTEEDHAYWLEQQLGLIDRIGLQNYLQSQAS